MEYIYRDQVGTDILIEVENVESVSHIIRASLVVKLPDGRITEWPLRIDTTENKLRYTIQPGDLKNFGKITAQPYIELDTGWKGYADPFSFNVKKTIKDWGLECFFQKSYAIIF